MNSGNGNVSETPILEWYVQLKTVSFKTLSDQTQLSARNNGYLRDPWSDKYLKFTVVNLTWHSTMEGNLKFKEYCYSTEKSC